MINEDVAPVNTTMGVNLTKDPVKRVATRSLNRYKNMIASAKKRRKDKGAV